MRTQLLGGYLVVLLLAATFNSLWLQAQTIDVGTTGGGTSFPFNLANNSHGARYQVCYEAGTDLLSAANGIIITEFNIWFNGAASSPSFSDLTIRFGYTNQTSNLSGAANFDANLHPDRPYWTTCYKKTSGTPQIIGTAGVDERARFILERPFAYNGQFNLLIDISYTGRSGTGFQIHGTGGRTTVYATGAGVGSTTTAPQTSNPFGNFRAEIVLQVRPNLDVVAHIGTQQVVEANATGTGGFGLQVAKFTVENNLTLGPHADLLTVVVQDLSSPGNVTTAYTHSTTGSFPFGVRLYRDDQAAPAPGAGVFDPSDVLIDTQNFTVDDGEITFNVPLSERSFTALQMKTYFIVVKLFGVEPGASTPAPLDQYKMRVKTITSSAGGFDPTGVGLDTNYYPYFAGILIDPPEFLYTEVALGMRTAYMNSTDNVMMAFEISYQGGPQNFQTDITITASGTGDDTIDFSGIRLYWDKDLTNSVTSNDDLVYTVPSGHFSSDDGNLQLPISTTPGDAGNFIAPVTRRFLLVVDFSSLGVRGSTFFFQVTGSGGHQHGAVVNGLPCSAAPQGGFVLEGNDLVLTRNGLTSTVTVNNNTQGPSGHGQLMLDFTLESLNGDWDVNDLIFTAGGTGNPVTAFTEVVLWEDINGDNQFNGPGFDVVATTQPVVVFTGGVGGACTATLLNGLFPSGQKRRFFLTVKMGGTAVTADTFWANLTDAGINDKPFGIGSNASQLDFSDQAGIGLLIDAPLLIVTAAPNNPLSKIIEQGPASAHTLAVFRFESANSDATVTGLTLATAGTGDFQFDLDPLTAIQIYADSNGNGTFDLGDQLLGQGAGATPSATINFTVAHLFIPNGEYRDVFVRINVLASAGASIADTFRVSIAAPGSVFTSSIMGVTLGLPAPNSNTLGVIVYIISSFLPLIASREGGEGIVIQGSGFTSPVSCSIGGVACLGVGTVNAEGTQITGLRVPPGSGKDLPIILTTSALGPRILPMTFSYAGSSRLPPGAGGGCAVESARGPTGLALATLAAAALWAVRRLRRRSA